MISDRQNGIAWLGSPLRAIFFSLALAMALVGPAIALIPLALGGAPLAVIALVGAFIIALPWIIFRLVVKMLWNRWSQRYAAQPILPGAVGRKFQSFSFGPLASLNNCIHIVVDEQHLHLIPMLVMRWCGGKRISLPWDRIEDVHPGMFGMSKAVIDDRRIAGPKWCMRLAEQQ